MKKLILILFIIIFGHNSYSQVTCNSFCVTNIEMDTSQSGMLYLTIFMAGSNTDFANYPYPSLVTTVTGDTLATGGMSLFGQIGNTSQFYYMSTTLDSIPDNLQAIIHFNFDTVQCILSYPCSLTGVDENEEEGLNIFPNPSDGIFNIEGSTENSLKELTIYDSNGRLVLIRNHNIKNNSIDLSAFPKGMYYLRSNSKQKDFNIKLIRN